MKMAPSKKRIMVYHHYDCDDRIDEHVLYQLQAFADFGMTLLFVSNSHLSQEEQNKIVHIVDAITIRDNEGFDWGAWKQVLMAQGKEYFTSYDELVLANCTCYGPLFPLHEMFDKMDRTSCDFWMPTNHLDAMGFPQHGQPYLVVFRQSLLSSAAFWNFWDTLPLLTTMHDAVWQGEIRLSSELSQAGYVYKVYYDSCNTEAVPEIGHVEPLCMNSSDFLIEQARMPFIKVKSVAERFSRLYSIAGYLFESLRAAKSDYPLELIVNHIRRTQPVSCQKNLPGSVSLLSGASGAIISPGGRVAICGYFKKSEELFACIGDCHKRSVPLDVLALVEHESCATEIRDAIAKEGECFRTLTIRVCPTHSSKKDYLLHVFRDAFDQYEYIIMVREQNAVNIPDVMQCRMGVPWLASLFAAEGHMTQISGLFHSEGGLGLLAPVVSPMLVIGKKLPFCMEAGLVQKLNEMGIRFRTESYLPVLTTGPCIVRASILRQLADHVLDQKNAAIMENVSEADLLDVLPYIAQAFGFYYKHVVTPKELVFNFSLYEDFICSVQFKNKIIHYNRLSFKDLCSELLKTLHGYLFYRFPGISRKRTQFRSYRSGI